MNSGYDRTKRVIDIIIAATMLILALPLCLVLVVILKLTGDREVFYTQPRVGYRNQPFRIIKFCSMQKGSEQFGSVTVRGDPRVLPIGRVLRATKLNELPQLINVLLGEMSIVGPRPLVDEGFRMYPKDVQERIYASTKPGLTGIGSVVFRNEEDFLAASTKDSERAYREDIMPLKGSLELWYVERKSIGLDLGIILATATLIVLPSNRCFRRLLPDLPDRWQKVDLP